MPLDPDFAALLQQVPKAGAKVPAAADPSAGGGTLSLAGFDTGIHTSQGVDRFLSGAGQGMTDLVRHAGNLVGLESDQDLQNAKATDAPLLNTGAGRAGQFVGQTAAMAPLGMGTGAALGKMGGIGARLAASPLTSGAIQGASQGALLADPGQRLKGALVGGAAGAALPILGAGVSKVAQGVARTPAAQALMDALPKGTLTPGQMNPSGMANRMEQALEGAFGVGDLVQNARDNAMHQYSRAMVQRSMAPGATLSGAAKDFPAMVDEAARSFDTAYDAGKGFPVGPKIMNASAPDVPLNRALAAVAARARPGITSAEQKSIGQNLQDLLQQTVKDAKQSGGMQSDNLLQFRSTLRDLARGENLTDNASRARASLYQDAQAKVTQAIESQIPQGAADAVRAADAQYAKFAIIRNAAKAAKDAPGGPTPFQISNAIAQATPPNTYARGGGLGRDLSAAARDTFQSNVPRTGLAGVGRLALPAAMATGAGLSHPLLTGAGLGGMAGLTLTRAGRSIAGGQTAPQQALAAALSRVSGAIPSQVKNLPQLYGQSLLLSGMAPRLQQP